MGRGPIITSAVDLTDGGNVVQARHELHQAIDFGGLPERANWAEKWGEAALAAGEKASQDAGEWDGFSVPKALDDADTISGELIAELAEEKPDIEKCRRLAKRLSGKIDDMLEAIEE